MTILSIGDLSQSFMMRRQTGTLKAALQTLSQELTTGMSSDLTSVIKGDFSQLNAITASITQLGSYTTATNEAGIYAGAMQTALGVFNDMATGLTGALLQGGSLAQPETIDIIGKDAEGRFQTAVSALNTRLGDRTLFAGIATDRSALADPDAILTALQGAVSGAATMSDVTTAIDNWFTNPSGFLAVAYTGSRPLAPQPISNGEVADLGITAADEGLRDTLKGLAMAALLNRGIFLGQSDARAQLAQHAGETILAAQPKRINTAAALGLVESRIIETSARNANERTSLEFARNAIVTVDPYDTATHLQDTQNQLETLFAITARLSRLSLTDYL